MNALREKVGGMFVVGFAGADPMAAADLIRRRHVGGVILFARNIVDARRTLELCAKLQELREEVSDTPLFIAVDQEGGCVARILKGVTVFPGNMALGAVGSERLAFETGAIAGAELSKLGININFAPVLDINSNPQNPGIGARGFGSDPRLVAKLGADMIRGMQESGLCATAKHFPGLGDARVDSHDELPCVDASAKELESRELIPFRSAIDANVSIVMTAHCSYPSLDKSLSPATLSRAILTDLLRKEMGFEGPVITDCLEMKAVEKTFSPAESAVLAVRAGADMLLICHTFQKQIAAIDSFVRHVEESDIPEETLNRAHERIASIRNRLEFPSASSRGIAPRTALAETIAARAITVTCNEGNLLPLSRRYLGRLAVIAPDFEALTKVEEQSEPHKALLDELRRFHSNLVYRKVAVGPSRDERSACVEACRDADVVLVLTYNLHQNLEQKELVNAILDTGARAVVAAVRDPYDLAHVSRAHACLATYGFRECSLRALARVLFGESIPEGRLPVELAERQS